MPSTGAATWWSRTPTAKAPRSAWPPTAVTADGGAGGGYAWVSDDGLVVAGGDGRLRRISADGGVIGVLTRDGRAFAPVVSARGEVACGIERDDACDIATVPLDGSQWPQR